MKLLAAAGFAVWIAAAPSSDSPAPQDAAASRPEAKPEDVSSPEALTAAVYAVISGAAGAERDWNRFRSLFHPGAKLIAMQPGRDGAVRPAEMSVDGYVARAGPYLVAKGFFERGVATKLDVFGAVAHAFSTYESRHKADDPTPFARGINSIQMLKTGGRWAVVAITWDEEREGQPIPAAYLPR